MRGNGMTDSGKVVVRNTGIVVTGLTVFFVSLFVFCGIAGAHDAKVNQAEYVAAIGACGHATDVSGCIAQVDDAFHNNNGG